MASVKEYLAFILDQLSGLEEITYRAMMGEYIIYYGGKVVGGIYDDRFLVKPVKSATSLMPNTRYELPYEGAKESNSAIALFQKACSLVKPGGSLYYQSLDENEDSNQIIKTAFANNMLLSAFLEEHTYGLHSLYFKFQKGDVIVP